MGSIQIESLSYMYPNNDGHDRVIDNLNLEIEEGEFVCLVGHSGCGKTTLLNLIAGLLTPSSGHIRVDGRDVCGPGLDRNVIFQHYSLFPWMTAKKNVAFGIRQAQKGIGKKEAEQKALQYLRQVELESVQDKYPFQLSGGMQQRVAIARAFAMNGPIMLLDEPFGALDPRIRAHLQQRLVELWQQEEKKKTIIFVTHDMDEAIMLADRILFMKPGCGIEELHINLPRPRREQDLTGTAAFCQTRSNVIHLFYQDQEERE